jgi:hypothetical protein
LANCPENCGIIIGEKLDQRRLFGRRKWSRGGSGGWRTHAAVLMNQTRLLISMRNPQNLWS